MNKIWEKVINLRSVKWNGFYSQKTTTTTTQNQMANATREIEEKRGRGEKWKTTKAKKRKKEKARFISGMPSTKLTKLFFLFLFLKNIPFQSWETEGGKQNEIKKEKTRNSEYEIWKSKSNLSPMKWKLATVFFFFAWWKYKKWVRERERERESRKVEKKVLCVCLCVVFGVHEFPVLEHYFFFFSFFEKLLSLSLVWEQQND